MDEKPNFLPTVTDGFPPPASLAAAIDGFCSPLQLMGLSLPSPSIQFIGFLNGVGKKVHLDFSVGFFKINVG
ncbi:hypothetical protein ACLOJK_004005, partial [Asimina triloba]